MEQTPAGFKTDFLRVILLFTAIYILSELASASLGLGSAYTKTYSVIYMMTLAFGIFITTILLALPNLVVIRTYGFKVIMKAVTNGFAFLFPFAMMAVLSDYVFKWNAAQPIASAALFTCVSISASDLMRLGGSKTGNLVFSFIASIVFLLLFMGCGMLANTFLK
ncbi:MAG: hypothetical protein WCI92_08310 [Bacteroidota bacterium]